MSVSNVFVSMFLYQQNLGRNKKLFKKYDVNSTEYELIGKEEKGLLAKSKNKKSVHGHKYIRKIRIFYDVQFISQKGWCECFYSYWTSFN